MLNWNKTLLKCSNREVVKACALVTKETSINGVEQWMDGETKIIFYTANRLPHKEIEEISECFPDEVIYCTHSVDESEYSEIHEVEYRNGKYKELSLEPSYTHSQISMFNRKDVERIYDKVDGFFRRLDRTKTNNNGNLFIDWFYGEVCYKFEFYDENGDKYRVEATKDKDYIDFKVFKGLLRYEWNEIQEIPNDGPFSWRQMT